MCDPCRFNESQDPVSCECFNNSTHRLQLTKDIFNILSSLVVIVCCTRTLYFIRKHKLKETTPFLVYILVLLFVGSFFNIASSFFRFEISIHATLCYIIFARVLSTLSQLGSIGVLLFAFLYHMAASLLNKYQPPIVAWRWFTRASLITSLVFMTLVLIRQTCYGII